jgi:RNA polymerase sigma factor (sigma-70 family)
MAGDATELGGEGRDFPHTTAGLRDRLRNPDPAARQAVMDALASRYWKPVYHFLRLTYGKKNEEAKDLAQAFFLWLLERDVLLKFDPARSSFRTFLKGVLRNFAGNEHQALQRLKRGGAVKHVPLDAALFDAAGAESDPEKAFDRVWMRDLVSRAVGRVKSRYETSRRLLPFLVFEAYDLAPGDPPSYAELAKRLGVKDSDVRNHLSEVRARVRDEVLQELRDLEGETDDSSVDWGAVFKGPKARGQ